MEFLVVTSGGFQIESDHSAKKTSMAFKFDRVVVSNLHLCKCKSS